MKVLKKIFKFLGIALLSFVLLIVVFLFGIKIWNHIAMNSEKEMLADHPGTTVEVDGQNMNIYVEGEGTHTLVFMAGWKCPSPMYSFKPLYSQLSDDYRCVVIEKFGAFFGMNRFLMSVSEFEGYTDEEMWVESHHNIVNASSNGQYVQLECGHNVYEYEADRIAGDIKSFLGE